MRERLGIAGSGAIACGLAATAAEHGEVVVWARSKASAERARAMLDDKVRIETDLDGLREMTVVVEAVVEDASCKADLLADLQAIVGPDSLLATTTSSLSVEQLAQASGAPERFVGFHVFNPVPKMKLVELAFPSAATRDTRRRARQLSEDLGKTPVEVPDIAGFVVNRLLFPYLFDAVRLLEESEMAAQDIDGCMTMGAGHPMGPLALLDFVGLDVALAIGEAIGADIPARLRELVAQDALGKKSGRGFFTY
jgi:3-hydroxybutyryl-CoA dehydrogenase